MVHVGVVESEVGIAGPVELLGVQGRHIERQSCLGVSVRDAVYTSPVEDAVNGVRVISCGVGKLFGRRKCLEASIIRKGRCGHGRDGQTELNRGGENRENTSHANLNNAMPTP
jgi:hypothetical protein